MAHGGGVERGVAQRALVGAVGEQQQLGALVRAVRQHGDHGGAAAGAGDRGEARLDAHGS